MKQAPKGLEIAATVLGSAGIAWSAYQKRALSKNGSLAATLVGSTTVTFGGLAPSLGMLAFFLSGSVLSRLGRSRKASLAVEWEKGDRRDAAQVFANGGVVSLCLAASALWGWPEAHAGAAGALAVAAADTWATELGSLSRSRPRMITTWRMVEPGTSGAITASGSLAALAGAVVVSSVFWPVQQARRDWLGRVCRTSMAGLVGSWIDSLLGATIQATFRCPVCQRLTERTVHGCGSSTELVKGVGWIRNDAVNLVSTGAGAVLAAFGEVLALRTWRRDS